eukprot:10093824-Prorocentrum_lima.AAC.1
MQFTDHTTILVCIIAMIGAANILCLHLCNMPTYCISFCSMLRTLTNYHNSWPSYNSQPPSQRLYIVRYEHTCANSSTAVSYTHLRAHETRRHL